MYTNKNDYWGEGHKCLLFLSTMPKTRTWKERQFYGYPRACTCTYETPPLIHLRGFCPHTLLDKLRYTVTQSAGNPSNIIVVGYQSAGIEYNSSLSQWVYSDPRLNVTARSRASQNSFALGKHNWTVSGDKYQCSEGK